MNSSNRSFIGYLNRICCGKRQSVGRVLVVGCVLARTQYLGLLLLFGAAVLLAGLQPGRLTGAQPTEANEGEVKVESKNGQIYIYTAPETQGQGKGQTAKKSKGLTKVGQGVMVISGVAKSDTDDQNDIIALPNYNLRLLREKSLVQELKITAEQKKKLRELPRKYYDDMQKFFAEKRNLSQDERMKEYRQWDLKQKKDIQKQVEKILNPSQMRTLKELTLRADAQVLFDPVMSEKIGLTAEQKDKLLSIQKEQDDQILQDIKETTDKMLAVLDPEQREQLADEALGPAGPEVIDTQQIDAGGEIGKIRVPSLFPYPDFSDEQVQKQLNLTESQLDQVREILGAKSKLSEILVEEWQKLPPDEQKKRQYTITGSTTVYSMGSGGNLSPEEQKKRQAEFDEQIRNDRQKRRAESEAQPPKSLILNLREQFEAILTTEQLATYKELAFRNIATQALTDHPTLNKVGVSYQQQAELNRLHEEWIEHLQQVQRGTGAKLLKLLTPEQKTKLQAEIERLVQ